MYFCFVYIFSLVIFARADPGLAPLVKLNDGTMMPMMAIGTSGAPNTSDSDAPAGHEIQQAVLWALEAGYRHVDTAWSYMVEDQVGAAVRAVATAYYEKRHPTSTLAPEVVCDFECYKNRILYNYDREGIVLPDVGRSEMFVTTKLWNDAHPRGKVLHALKKSLKKLTLTHVDLYLMHWPIGQYSNQTYDPTHYLDTWRGMIDAKTKGLTYSIGVCNFNRIMLESIRTHKLAMPAVLQIEWNLNLQQPDLLAYCKEHNIAVFGSLLCKQKDKQMQLAFSSHLWNLNLQQPDLLAYCKEHSIAVMGYTVFGSLLRKQKDRQMQFALATMAAKYQKTAKQIVLRYAIEMGVTPVIRSLKSSLIFEYINVFDFQLEAEDRRLLGSYNNGYRSNPNRQWADHPFYPFERVPHTTTTTTSTTTTTPSTPITTPTQEVMVTPAKNASTTFKDMTLLRSKLKAQDLNTWLIKHF